jgi:hypothetical protein
MLGMRAVMPQKSDLVILSFLVCAGSKVSCSCTLLWEDFPTSEWDVVHLNTSLSFFTVFATLLITLPGYDEHRGLAHS